MGRGVGKGEGRGRPGTHGEIWAGKREREKGIRERRGRE